MYRETSALSTRSATAKAHIMTKTTESCVFFADSRTMPELEDSSIQLVVTSPPYYHIKDYGSSGQIGFGQTLHTYLEDLYRVWNECYRVLSPGRRLCINIGDQFARTRDFGRYKVIPLHAEIISQCEGIGMDYMGAIIWQKKTTINTSGGAVVMGSFPYPPNGIVELDYEFILLFKKPETAKQKQEHRVPKEKKQTAQLTLEEWKEYFAGHWNFSGEKKTSHEAAFPIQLPYRLIKMFTFEDEYVLDPFLGTGTTLIAALETKRRCIGYEIQRRYQPNIEEKIGLFAGKIPFKERSEEAPAETDTYRPSIMNMTPQTISDPNAGKEFKKVHSINGPAAFVTDDGLEVTFRGITVPAGQEQKAEKYLQKYLVSKQIELKDETPAGENAVTAYVYLKNRIFVNRKMLEMGLARATGEEHRLAAKFKKAEEKGRTK